MTWLSLNCRERQGQPNAEHQCRVCDCACHHVPAPGNLRELVEAAKATPMVADDEALIHELACDDDECRCPRNDL